MKKHNRTQPRNIADYLVVLGVGLGGIYWIVESALDSFAFHLGEFQERMFSPDANELWMRLLVIGVLILLSYYAQTMLAERKREGKVLRERTAMFQGLFESAPDAIFVVNDEGRIVRLNRQAVRMFGYGRDELVGQPIETLMSEHLRERHAEYCVSYAASPRIHPMGADVETYARRKDGTEFPVDIMLSHLDLGGGKVALSVARDITEHKRADNALREYAERLQSLSRRLVEVQEAERRHLARELHDEIGQLLTGLKLTLEMSSRLPAESVMANMDQAGDLVNDIMGKVRQLSLDLRPAMLDDLGLVPTLVWQFERYTVQTKVVVTFKGAGLDGRRFAPDIETTAYRLVQEALTNVARHAGVPEVTVRIWADQETLNVQIEDEGIGFDPEATLATSNSIGLAGMRERALLVGGTLTVESAPGEGSRLTFELPLGDPVA